MPTLVCLPPIIDSNSRVLILGTMPGAMSLQKQQYYANPGNRFWNIIYGLFDLPLEKYYEARVNFVKTKGIGLWDVLAQCSRAGSSDSSIRDIVVNDFGGLLKNYPNVRCLAFSSRKAFQLFDKHVKLHSKEIEKRLIKLIVLPSPSGQFARMSYTEKLNAWRIIREYLR